ncbi:hypothetical protein BDZ89DRAFT_180010 [Hymenopellis radicata]|nr:hypothetical protein BDZ89DRAFT_180010 [Hymenopellis radicata]
MSFFQNVHKCTFTLREHHIRSLFTSFLAMDLKSACPNSKRYGLRNATVQGRWIGLWKYSIALLLLFVFGSSVGKMEILLCHPTALLASCAWLTDTRGTLFQTTVDARRSGGLRSSAVCLERFTCLADSLLEDSLHLYRG